MFDLKALMEKMSFVEQRGDSVLEEQFWQMLLRSEEGWNLSLDQFQIGRYRVDAIFAIGDQAVVIELDGAAFHWNVSIDEARDAELLRDVSAVVRIPYHAMRSCPDATFAVLAQWWDRFRIPLLPNVISFQEFGKRLTSQDYEVWDVSFPFTVGRASDYNKGTVATISRQLGGDASPSIIDRIHKQQRNNG
jgi:very-short-patch-repair endonuclease